MADELGCSGMAGVTFIGDMECICMHLRWLVHCSHDYLCVSLLYFQCHPYQSILKVLNVCLSVIHIKVSWKFHDVRLWYRIITAKLAPLPSASQPFCHTPTGTTPGDAYWLLLFLLQFQQPSCQFIPYYTLPIPCKNRLLFQSAHTPGRHVHCCYVFSKTHNFMCLHIIVLLSNLCYITIYRTTSNIYMRLNYAPIAMHPATCCPCMQ